MSTQSFIPNATNVDTSIPVIKVCGYRLEITQLPNTMNGNHILLKHSRDQIEASKIKALGITDNIYPLMLQNISRTQKYKR